MAGASGSSSDRPLRDLAVRLVNDMLAQANRVALEKMEPDQREAADVLARLRTQRPVLQDRDEGDIALGTRLEVSPGSPGSLA